MSGRGTLAQTCIDTLRTDLHTAAKDLDGLDALSDDAGTPLVSVIIPVHNVAAYIGETLHSVLAQQGLRNFEVLLVDDRSTDATVAQAQAAAAGDPRVQVLHNTGPQGAAGARNFGLARARGRWVAFLDGDDLWEPDNLAVKMAAARAHPNERIITSDYYNENATNRSVPRAEWPSLVQSRRPAWVQQLQAWAPAAGQVLRLERPTAGFIAHDVLGNTGTFVLRREDLQASGGFDTTLEVGEDVFLWIQLTQRTGSVLYVHKPLMFYRYRPGSLTNQDYPAHAMFAARFFQMLAQRGEFAPFHSLIKQRLARAYFTQSVYHRQRRHFGDALSAAWKAVVNQPTAIRHWKNLVAACIGR